MNGRSVALALLLLAGLALALLATSYLAGAAYFVANKAMPHDIAFDTWYRYWLAYDTDPLQHKRLTDAALAAAAVVFGVPLCACAATAQRPRPLHGDARWASAAEIRKAGLL